MATRTRSAPRASRKQSRFGAIQLLMVGVAVATVASLLLVALPTKQVVAGEQLPTFAPLAPQADAHRSESGLALDVPFQVQFTKPMNEASVEAALTIQPATEHKLLWDATSQVLSIVPGSHWEPYTDYTIDITNKATDQEGLSLATEIHTSFASGSPTAGTLAATLVVDNLVAPNTAFTLTFTRPVKLSTVMTRLSITPAVDVTIVGDDPTDAASATFTITPKAPLASDSNFVVSFADGGTDSSGAALQPVAQVSGHTMKAPAVLSFRPQDGTVTLDTGQLVSVRFSAAMDKKATESAFSVTADGRAVSGNLYWSEGDTVLALAPRYAFKVGSKVVARITTTARSATGMHLEKVSTATFTVSKPRTPTVIARGGSCSNCGGGGGGTGAFGSVAAQRRDLEVYYLGLMNCTRTGGWLTSSGGCSTAAHHTMPAQPALNLDDTISLKVARPYAKYLADRNLLTHSGGGTTTRGRFQAAGYGGGSWGENIASPHNDGTGGMIASQLFFQAEAPYRGGHYYNIMDVYFHRVGIGVWVSNSIRLVVDFYG
ncbi:MAG: Ig-like domain-containing protein [Candidatus Limnocylindrales bacterium]